MACKGICKHLYPHRSHITAPYTKGLLCTSCWFRAKTNDVRCKCCGMAFRRSSKNNAFSKHQNRI